MKKYVIIIDNEYEYDLYVEERKRKIVYSLHYSENEVWSSEFRGVLALTMTDTGNNIKFGSQLKVMDYSKAEQVRILLNFEKSMSNNKANADSEIKVYLEAENPINNKPINIT